MKKLTDKQAVRLAVFAVAGLVVTIVIAFGLLALVNANKSAGMIEAPATGPMTTTAAMAEQKSLDGQWVADSNGIKLTATVLHDTIKVELQSNDTTIDFWDGSFESFAKVGDVVGSVRTQDGSIMVSSDQEKTFVIGDGTISFDLSFMGVTKHVKATHV